MHIARCGTSKGGLHAREKRPTVSWRKRHLRKPRGSGRLAKEREELILVMGEWARAIHAFSPSLNLTKDAITRFGDFAT